MSQVLPILPFAVGQDVRLNFYKPQIWNSTEFVKELYNASGEDDDTIYRIIFGNKKLHHIIHMSKYAYSENTKKRYRFEVQTVSPIVLDVLDTLLDSDNKRIVARAIQEVWAILDTGIAFPHRRFYTKILNLFFNEDFTIMSGVDDIKYWGSSFIRKSIALSVLTHPIHQRNILKRLNDRYGRPHYTLEYFKNVKETDMILSDKMDMMWDILEHDSRKIIDLLKTYQNELHMIEPLCLIISSLCIHDKTIYDNFVENGLYELLDRITGKVERAKRNKASLSHRLSLSNIASHIEKYLLNDIAYLKETN